MRRKRLGAGAAARVLPTAAAVAWLCSSGLAAAQALRVEPAVQANAVATNNVAYAANGNETADVVLTVAPRLQVTGRGASYRVIGTVGFDGVHYAQQTVADRVLPRVDLNLNAVLVDRLLFIDSGVYAGATAANAFGVLGEGATTFNRGITTRQRISPYIQRELGPRTSLLARSDNTWVQTEVATSTTGKVRSYVQSDIARLDVRPMPFGMRAEATRLDTQASSTGVGSNTTFDVARLVALYGPVPELRLGLVGGRDRATYSGFQQEGAVKGGSLWWTPTDRTLLDVLVEKRFFGTGWNGTFTHRSPFMSISATAYRQATTYSALLASLQPGASNNVGQLLDAALTTQYPDPAQRAIEVNNLINRYNLPNNLSGALDLYTNTAQIEQRFNLALALLGSRHTVTLSAFRQQGQDLVAPGQSPPSQLFSADARQYGGTLNVTRRLAPDSTADFSLTGVRIIGYGPRDGQSTTNKIARLGATHNLSPRTAVTGGVRRQLVTSTTVPNAQVTSVYVGALHRF